MNYTLEEINDAVKNGIPISKDINKISCTLEEIKAINKAPLYNWDDSDAAYQSDVNAALDTARKASKDAKAAWNDYNDSLKIQNREIWDAACHDYNIAAAAADTAWENARNVVNKRIGK